VEQDIFTLGGQEIRLGERRQINLEVAKLYDFTGMSVPVEVVRGKQHGPTLFISAAVHGDEINGVEIVKRLLHHRLLSRIYGTLIAVPIVNVFGFNTKSRYLPDRRDLNRCFPGDENGSLASQLAHIFMEEVVKQSDFGIDLHTGAIHRSNVPQIRATLDDPMTLRLARAFGVPMVINSNVRDGSLREAAQACKIPTLLFEGGEALRFNPDVIRIGVRGILLVMQEIGMLSSMSMKRKPAETTYAKSSFWVRAPHSGILVVHRNVGEKVAKKELLGVVSDPFGHHRFEVRSKYAGTIIGGTVLPLVNEGDALFHIAVTEDSLTDIDLSEKSSGALMGQSETYVM
jgi:predicted deacylase